MREKDLVYLLKHIDKDEAYSHDLEKFMNYANKMLKRIQTEHIIDGDQYKLAELQQHLEQILLLTCEICSGVSRSEYSSDETLDEYMKSKRKLEAMYRKTAHRPSEVNKTEIGSFKSELYSLAVEYLESTNFDKVTIATLSKYIIANMYHIDIENSRGTIIQTLKREKGSEEVDKFLKHVTNINKLLLSYPDRYTKREILSKLRAEVGGD